MTNSSKEIKKLKEEIKELEETIREKESSLPAHSVKPEMMLELEDLEENLSRKKKELFEIIDNKI
ncbi:MAG: histidine kinase [Actinobacteria bacterium]|nr:histidine kinase [Actinomycetota bacterium]